jgi:branched-chain amino acid transport system ATP-binding protein
MLEISNIEVVYDKVIYVLRGVSLEVPQGNIICLLGANGVGKSTTLKSISGLIRTELGEIIRGDIKFDGISIIKKTPEDIVKLGIIQVWEGRKVCEHLTVEQNLRAGTFVRQDGTNIKRDLSIVYDYFPRLKDVGKKKMSGYLSGGEQQMLVIGRAMMAHPKLILLDEPSLGLSPVIAREIFRIIERLNKEERTTFLLVEQNVKASLDVSQYGYVMENGRIVLDGPAEELRNNEDIREFYLGLSQLGSRKSYREAKAYKRRKRWLG